MNSILKEVKELISESIRAHLPNVKSSELEVILKNEADDKQIWDNSIERINSTIELSDEKFQEYRDNEQFYEDLKNRLKLYNSIAIVSKKITEEGWKVGYMVRDEQYNEQDSGWSFYAGNEDDDYIADKNNTIILRIHDVCNIDDDIKNYIENPVGTSLIRISSDEFEIDNQTKEIYTEKRNGFDKNY